MRTPNLQRYLALVRGINVGRAKRVAMADLRQLVGELGYADVRSVLNSGNIVFSAPALAPGAAQAAIEEALVRKLGVAARVMVLPAATLAQIVDDNPLLAQADDHARMMAFVLGDPASRARIEPLCKRDWKTGAVALGRHAAYVWCPDGVLDSEAATLVGKLLGETTTARNWNIIARLHALCAGAA